MTLTKNISIFLFLSTIICLQVYSQTTISGKVLDSLQKPIAGCNVLLLAKNDSALVKAALSNANGSYEIKEVKSGTYLLSFSHVGFAATFFPVEITTAHALNMPATLLSSLPTELAAVVVTAKKPLFEQHIDRLTINVKASITNAGGTVLDVLQKSPGIVVNRQNNSIQMNGKDGVNVMINGKLNYMPADALVNMLESIPSANVEKIELITTPPAKYDAGGNAGYINIVLSQTPDRGFNGSYTLTMGAWNGTYPAGSFNFNYRKKKVNFYGSAGASRLAQIQVLNNYRSIFFGGKQTETFSTSTRDPYQLNFNATLGMDLQLNKKTVLGVLVSGYNNRWYMTADNTSEIVVDKMIDSSIHIHTVETNHWKHNMVNINVQHTLPGNATISFNIDYLHYSNSNPTNYINNYFDKNNQPHKTTLTQSGKNTNIEIFPLQFDFRKAVNKKLSVEAGAKSIFSKFKNDVLIAENIQGNWQPDPNYSGIFNLKENIAAAYASMDYAVNEKNTIKAGLRFEHTYSNISSQIQKDIVNRKYGSLFPSVYWLHSLNEKNTLTLSYSRRINRPTFNNLAPFLIFLDPNTFISGNIALQPSFTDAIKADYTFKQLIFSVGYSYEKDAIGDFQAQVNKAENKLFLTAQNLKFMKTINSNITLPFKITKWWSSYFNITGKWQQAQADFTGTPFSISVFTYSLISGQNFTLPKNYGIEVSSFYNSKTVFGVYLAKPFGSLSVGLQKKFTNSSLKFVADDIFSTMRFRIINDVPKENFYYYGNFQFSTRMFKLTYTQNFGNKILKQKRDRNTASDDMQGRVTN